MLGTRGVPAQYGGFETAVEEIGSRLAGAGHSVTVFCRERRDTATSRYRGMSLVDLPSVRNKHMETLSHTTLSAVHRETRRADVAFLFNAANAPLVPVIKAFGVPVAVHVDGLEWMRSKWGRAGRRYYLSSERLAVATADALIADARGIADYYLSRYQTASTFIPYGARLMDRAAPLRHLSRLSVERGQFHLVVARFEPENNIHEIIAGYRASEARLPLLVVGSAPYAAAYSAEVERLAGKDGCVRLLGGVWDQDLLDDLYCGCLTYLHGHSVGGTNPSLLRGMGAGAAVLAKDVLFNREVLGPNGVYWADAMSIPPLLAWAEADRGAASALGSRARDHVRREYDWDAVAAAYGDLAEDLQAARRSR